MERRHTAWFNTHPFTGGLFSNEAGFFIETIIVIIILDAALERRRRERWNYVHDKHIQRLCADLSDAISNIVNSYGQSYFDLYLQTSGASPRSRPVVDSSAGGQQPKDWSLSGQQPVWSGVGRRP
jgi:hypothetical protein